ncbi:hypothetical protein ACA910_004259 [Epithemia clementina (nom. ined.)]
MNVKVRPVVPNDISNIKQVIESNEDLFPSEMLDGMIDPYFKEQNCIWLTADLVNDDDTATTAGMAVAYCAPEAMTDDRVWNMYLLAVHASWHGHGIGTQLVQFLENELVIGKTKPARILLVETSGNLPKTRQFYETRCGFVQEGRIRDYYDVGDDKIIYWKKLQPS